MKDALEKAHFPVHQTHTGDLYSCTTSPQMFPANHFMKYAAVELEPKPLKTTRYHTVQTTSEGLCLVARIEETT